MVDKDKLKEDINKMYLAEPYRRCYGCIHFDYHPVTGAGAPERRPWYKCDLLDIGCNTGFTRDVRKAHSFRCGMDNTQYK